jgi:hypothetical protein
MKEKLGQIRGRIREQRGLLASGWLISWIIHLEMGWTWPILKLRLRDLYLFSFMSYDYHKGFLSSSSSSSSRGFLYTLQFNASWISLDYFLVFFFSVS